MPHHGGTAGGGDDVRTEQLSAELRHALREWAEVVDAVVASGDDQQIDLVRRRGRQLAARVAGAVGRPVRFVDPVSGAVESVPAEPPAATSGARHVRAPEPPGPTPWGTGAVVGAFFAVLTAVADIALARSLAGAFGWLWIPANLLVTAGTAPTLWFTRRVPFWRWPAFGVAAGLAAAWLVLLVGLLAA